MWKIRPLSFWKPEKLQAGMQKYPPDPPFRPEPPSWADDRAAKQKAKSSKNNVITSKVKILFYRRARRAGKFHFPLFFMSGRNPGASACPDLILPEWAGRKARQIVHVLIPSYPTDQKSGLLAKLHGLDPQVPEHRGGAAVLHALLPVTGLFHIGLPRDGPYSDAAYDNVNMDIPSSVVPIGVGADDGGMTRKVFLAELQAKGLGLFQGQSVVRGIPRVKADVNDLSNDLENPTRIDLIRWTE